MTPLSSSLPLAGTLPAPGPDWRCHSPSEPCGGPLGLIPPALTGGSSPRGLGSPKQQFPSLSCYLLGPDSLPFFPPASTISLAQQLLTTSKQSSGSQGGGCLYIGPHPPSPHFPEGPLICYINCQHLSPVDSKQVPSQGSPTKTLDKPRKVSSCLSALRVPAAPHFSGLLDFQTEQCSQNRPSTLSQKMYGYKWHGGSCPRSRHS